MASVPYRFIIRFCDPGFETNLTAKTEEIETLVDSLLLYVRIPEAEKDFFDHLKLVEKDLMQFSKSAVIDQDFVKYKT